MIPFPKMFPSQKEKIKVYLKSGIIFEAKYEIDDYDEIYASWVEQRSLITFSNGEFLVSEIAGIEWKL